MYESFKNHSESRKKMKIGTNDCDFLQKGMCECHNIIKNSQNFRFFKSAVVPTHANKSSCLTNTTFAFSLQPFFVLLCLELTGSVFL